MKKLLLLILYLIIFTPFAKANLGFAQLDLKLYDDAPFVVVLDTQRFYSPSNHFVFHNLFPGTHLLQVIRTETWGNPYQAVGPTYTGLITLSPNTIVFAKVLQDCSLVIENTGAVNSESSCSNSLISKPASIAACASQPMSDSFFDHLKNTLSGIHPSNTRMEIAKRAVTNNSINSVQLAEIIPCFDFDIQRLELAKFAYPYVADKENFFIIYSSFIFEGSKKELLKYLYGPDK